MKSVKSIRIIIAEVLILSTCVCIYYLVALDKPSVVNVVPERSVFEGRMPGNDEMPKNNFLPEQFKNEVEQSIDLSSLPFKPLVAPISAFKIQPVIRTIEAGAGEKITTGKFSIQFPPNSFIDKKGKTVTGKVDVTCREFHNPWDMFVAGIPMHYDSGSFNVLESAGMMDINATKNGEAVYPNPEKVINVFLKSSTRKEGFNIYYYDSLKNNWAYQSNNFTWLEESDSRVPGLQTFTYTTPPSYGYMITNSNMKPRRNFLFGQKRQPTVFTFKFSPVQKATPELSALRNVKWVYEGDDAAYIFEKLFFSEDLNKNLTKVRVDNILVEQRDSNFIAIFNKGGEHFELTVQPLSDKGFESSLIKYRKKLDNRYAAEKVRFADFQKDTVEKRIKHYASLKKTETKLLRAFSINQFGMWNVDKPVANDLPAVANAVFTDKKGNVIPITSGYMVMRNINTLIPVKDMNRFRYRPDGGNIFWAVLNNDVVAVVTPQEFKRHPLWPGKATFKVELFDNLEQTKAFLKKEFESINRLPA